MLAEQRGRDLPNSFRSNGTHTLENLPGSVSIAVPGAAGLMDVDGPYGRRLGSQEAPAKADFAGASSFG